MRRRRPTTAWSSRPTFNIGMAQHHLAFAGTISLRPSTFMAAITDWVSSLSRHGFERIYFLNGHGGNVSTIEATFSELYAEWSFAEEPCRPMC
jgi:creatinine amidohydrolase